MSVADTRSWFRLLRSELRLVASRRRNIAGLSTLAAVGVLIAVVVKIWGLGGGGGPTFMDAITDNGLFVALTTLSVELTLFLPLAIATIAADAIAGEANTGTLRYLLTAPAGRTRLLAIKYTSIVIFALVAVLVVVAISALIGVILFGGGSMTLLSGTQISLAAASWRLLLACGYLAAGLAALGAVALFVSTLTEQPIAAIVTVMLTTIGMGVADSIDQLTWLHPWLLTHWWTAFVDLFRDPVFGANLRRGLWTALGYAGVFWLAAWSRFTSKDITS